MRIAPQREVSHRAMPARRTRLRTSGSGSGWRLRRPALTTAISGASARNQESAVDEPLP